MTVINNELNIPVDVFVMIDDKITTIKPAGMDSTGNRVSHIPAHNGSKPGELNYQPFDSRDIITKSFSVIFVLNYNPVKDGVKGVNIAISGTNLLDRAVGTVMNIPHHFAYYEKKGKFYAEIHYMVEIEDSEKNVDIKSNEIQDIIKKQILIDINPTIKHPPSGD